MTRIFRARGSSWHTTPIAANGQAGCAAYRRDERGDFVLHTVQMFEVSDGRIQRVTVFQDPEVFALFGLPARWVDLVS
jgi:RNA polymerase sigma-70 factor (ECF subfamily)